MLKNLTYVLKFNLSQHYSKNYKAKGNHLIDKFFGGGVGSVVCFAFCFNQNPKEIS